MARLKSFSAAVSLMTSRLTGEGRRQDLVKLAQSTIAEATALNRQALGEDVDRTIIVDGRRGASVESVKPGGTVVALFAVHQAAIDFSWKTLAALSPVDESSRADDLVYRDQHLLLINGDEAGPPPVSVGPDDVVTFVNLLAYARRLERGWSKKQAPDGIYEVALPIIRARFGNIVDIRFGYGAFLGATAARENRYPFLELSPKRRSRR